MQNENVKSKVQDRGVVLLMVVFMMSIFLSAGLVLSVVFLRSLKTSQNLAESIIAFHAADTGLEHIVYTVREGLPDPSGSTAICEASGPPADNGAFSVGGACYIPVKKESATSIFVYAFGKFPMNTPRVSRSIGALFTK